MSNAMKIFIVIVVLIAMLRSPQIFMQIGSDIVAICNGHSGG